MRAGPFLHLVIAMSLISFTPWMSATPAWPILLAENPPSGGSGLASMLPALMMIVVVFYFLLIRPEQGKRKAHQALMDSLKKNDRIVTVGGIHGVVTNVQRDADELTVRIDESNNTKIRITLGSVARVIPATTDGEKSDKP